MRAIFLLPLRAPLAHLPLGLVFPADDRLFHTDLPMDSSGLRVAPRSSAALAREQHLRDRVSHGRGQTADASTHARTPRLFAEELSERGTESSP